ncbi:hypothetical protein NDU88_008102 [Pleurodeles waltl]|uniref:Uncharacterized protein n=1 Tax=Pleurodeles waltl TaxID=8319 RepID=A0AAV7PNJ2_PLEWA|nr:hypothetical protein NDU88_008102 [Pleurodeles waltl]
MFKILHNSAPIGGSTTIKDSDTGPIRDVAELTEDGDSTGPGRLASSDSGGLLQVKTDAGSRFLDTHQTVSCIAGGPPQFSVSCVGGNGLAAAFEVEIDQPLYAPGSQSNVGLAQEVVTGVGYCEQAAAAAYLLPSTDPQTLACTLEVIRDYRQGREDSLVQGEVGENFFSLSDQSQESDEDSISPSIDSETCDSSTAPLTPISVLRGTAVKCQSKQTEVSRLEKAGESSEKRGKKKKASRTRSMSWDYTETQQLLHSVGDLSVAPAQTEVNVLNAETAPPSPSLHLIYQTITSQHKQMQRDSKKARVATKQLKVAISKVAKTCSETGERIAAIECRADVLESDLGAVTKQAAMHETQLSDIQWKVEDFENRQRRNNLRLIGIQEDKMAVMKAKIIQLYLDQDIIKAQIRTQECYEFSERVGKVLAYKTRQKAARSAILAIKDRLGQIVYGDTSVLQVFKEYYSVLYQQESLFLDDRDERIAQYLSDMSCPKLIHQEVEITPQLVLQGIDGVVYLEYSQRFLFLAMSVARCCIASDWLESTPPTFNHWLARMCSMFYLEMGSYACKGRGRRRMGEAIWAPFAQWLGNN